MLQKSTLSAQMIKLICFRFPIFNLETFLSFDCCSTGIEEIQSTEFSTTLTATKDGEAKKTSGGVINLDIIFWD